MLVIRHILWRLIQTLFVVSFLAHYAVDVMPPHLSQKSLHLEAETRWKASYATTSNERSYIKPSLKYPRSPDTTAVILNWSRLPNVVQLVKVMCNSLEDTLAEVLVWNNNPRPLTSEVSALGTVRKHSLTPKRIS